MAMLRIAELELDPPLVLAPMAGITDSPLRRVVRRVGGCGLVTSEFVSSEALSRSIASEESKLGFHQSERPIAIQICGTRPEAMAAAAVAVAAAGADVCDINMGCPARKIVKTGAGAALMGDPDRARRIVRAMRRAITIPLTVKLRAGIRADELNYLELAKVCAGEGADAVTLHPRTARQQYSGQADWSHIARLSEQLEIPVIGNGDVRSADDALRMFRETGCDAVMIGRAAVISPWIFPQAAALVAGDGSTALPEPCLEERLDLVRYHTDLLAGQLEEGALLHKLKVLTRWFTRGLPGGRRLRQELSTATEARQLLDQIHSFLDQQRAQTR